MKVLVTGGMGYIGSHTCIQMIEAGMTPVILDNLYNSNPAVLHRIEKVCGISPKFIKADIRDKAALVDALQSNDIEAVIHFAGLKAVGESVAKPLEYYDNNVNGTLVLVDAMREAGVKSLVFSSSATVYGDPASVPITEDFPTSATNPYGRSKLMVEECLTDFQKRTQIGVSLCYVISTQLALIQQVSLVKTLRDSKQPDAIYLTSCRWSS